MITKRLPLTILILLTFIIILAGCNKNNTSPPQNDPVNVATKTGAELVETYCNECHSLDRVTRDRDDDQWQLHVQRMLDKSPEMLTEQEYITVVTHLKEKY